MPDQVIQFDRVRVLIEKPQAGYVVFFNVWQRSGCQCVLAAPTLEEFLARWLEITGDAADPTRVQRAVITAIPPSNPPASEPAIAAAPDPGAGE